MADSSRMSSMSVSLIPPFKLSVRGGELESSLVKFDCRIRRRSTTMPFSPEDLNFMMRERRREKVAGSRSMP